VARPFRLKSIKGNQTVARGGKRDGAGRKPGSTTTRTREIADRAAAEGVTPLEVMLEAMRTHYEAKRFDDAAAVAKDAAPYMHPRLAAIEHGGKDGQPIAVAVVERIIVDSKAHD
jgi:hypothetical protein